MVKMVLIPLLMIKSRKNAKFVSRKNTAFIKIKIAATSFPEAEKNDVTV